MAVQAKLRCIGNTDPEWSSPTRIVRLTPVYGESGENAEWSKYTPAGYFEMTVTNPAAFEQFEVNGEYLVTFERVAS